LGFATLRNVKKKNHYLGHWRFMFGAAQNEALTYLLYKWPEIYFQHGLDAENKVHSSAGISSPVIVQSYARTHQTKRI
jgi:hypothetical protein